jgi:predicted MFS family arabinose efflux permease
LHEALDQSGALVGPLITAFVLAHHGRYREAFLWLGIPAAITVMTIVAVSLRFPQAGHVSSRPAGAGAREILARAFWLYAASAALVGFGFADWPLVAYHFAQAKIVSQPVIPVLYAIAMGGSGAGALALGRLFDSRGFVVLVPAILLAAIVTPLAFLGTGAFAIAGAVLWGVVLGMENSVLTAGVAHVVPAAARARAYGIFSAAFGLAWFAGSALLGALYDVSFAALTAVSIAAELAALIPLVVLLKGPK